MLMSDTCMSELDQNSSKSTRTRPAKDWLIEPADYSAKLYQGENEHELLLTNGLISRTWRIAPNAATISYDNLMTGESIIRGVKPEALLQIDSVSYEVGGLEGQPDYAYLRNEWVPLLTANSEAFQFTGFETGPTEPRFPWKRVRYSANSAWPPPGVKLTLHFQSPIGELRGVTVSVHYEMFDHIPLLSKWITVTNDTGSDLVIDTFTSEILAVVEWESPVETPERWDYPNIHIESDYSFQGMTQKKANRTTKWIPDEQYTTQVNYDMKTPSLLVSRPPLGPDAIVLSGTTFETFRTFELIHDSTDRERKGLAQKRMYRTIAPWVTENPILMHVLSDQSEVVKNAIDQCAEVGFEMVIISFGSGFNMESDDPEYIARLKQLADYAHHKGIQIGGYSLLASRSISSEDDVVTPNGAYYVHAPCLGSTWGQRYFDKLQAFFQNTGFDVLEHDGSYAGDVCHSHKHPGHRGYKDSQWSQWRTISGFYRWCRENGIYLNVPDWYFLVGSNKAGMGYREVNWSLPRDRQIMIARQNIYDGTWEKTPSMGWMFVPLMEYQGGGAEATIEPLCEHLDTYGAHLMTNFSSGVQATYRGSRLYDTEETKSVVKEWVDFYKKYREILDSDIVHVRRPDGRDLDCILHVNPQLKYKGLAVIYNPLDRQLNTIVDLPLYYTGLTERATVKEQGHGVPTELKLDRKYHVQLALSLPAKSGTWFVIE